MSIAGGDTAVALRLAAAGSRPAGGLYYTPSGEPILLRHCHGLAEFDACVELQQQTWSYPDRELAPRKTFVLAQELGGQVLGAFDSRGSLVAFAMAMAAIPRPAARASLTLAAGAYIHSHMLAVRPEYRGSGIGQQLKLLQREDALSRDISLMTWTFDPMAAKNANLNLHRLGAVARRYSPDFYGVSSSRLQGGLPSDRLHAEWWLESPRVRARVSQMCAVREGGGRTATEDAPPPEKTILLPAAIEAWKAEPNDIENARTLQETNRKLFQQAFAEGLVATGFHRDADGNGVYELSRWSPLPSHSAPITPLRAAHED